MSNANQTIHDYEKAIKFIHFTISVNGVFGRCRRTIYT